MFMFSMTLLPGLGSDSKEKEEKEGEASSASPSNELTPRSYDALVEHLQVGGAG